ncbi:MAG: V-type ATP synthase subunit D [Oscillospiraceae bacterium]|nr:V-type ATP synthase subunit D [Oscillospiraceae bacterium]
MAISYKPTRMEMSRLKKRLVTATRGHKLMKDKRDETVRRFITFVRRNKELRERVEALMAESMQSFVIAKATMSSAAVEEALCYPASAARIGVESAKVLSTEVPRLSYIPTETHGLPYGVLGTSSELDNAVARFSELMPLLIELAEVEKTCNLLADEIEKTRRRVNALEYVMIPQLKDAIHDISMKLDENERGNLTRLMKTKDMLKQKEG